MTGIVKLMVVSAAGGTTATLFPDPAEAATYAEPAWVPHVPASAAHALARVGGPETDRRRPGERVAHGNPAHDTEVGDPPWPRPR